MEPVKRQKIIKILGILCVIIAVITLFFGIGAVIIITVGATSLTDPSNAGNPETAQELTSMIIVCIMLIVSGILNITEGIISIRTSKNMAKVKALWMNSLICFMIHVCLMIYALATSDGAVYGYFFAASTVLGGFLFVLAVVGVPDLGRKD